MVVNPGRLLIPRDVLTGRVYQVLRDLVSDVSVDDSIPGITVLTADGVVEFIVRDGGKVKGVPVSELTFGYTSAVEFAGDIEKWDQVIPAVIDAVANDPVVRAHATESWAKVRLVSVPAGSEAGGAAVGELPPEPTGGTAREWIDWMHNMARVGYNFTLREISRKSGSHAYGTIKNAHEGCSDPDCPIRRRRKRS